MAKQITYFEHYPHYMGTMNITTSMSMEEFEQLLQFAVNNKDDEEDACIECLEARGKGKVFALGTILRDEWGNDKCKKLLDTLKKGGTFADRWEEGSYAFSTEGSRAAHNAVGRIEADFVGDEFDYD